MSGQTTITVKTNKRIKQDAQRFLDSLGINMTAAINMFLNDMVSNQRLEFSLAPTTTLHEISYDDLTPEEQKEYDRVMKNSDEDFIYFTADA